MHHRHVSRSVAGGVLCACALMILMAIGSSGAGQAVGIASGWRVSAQATPATHADQQDNAGDRQDDDRSDSGSPILDFALALFATLIGTGVGFALAIGYDRRKVKRQQQERLDQALRLVVAELDANQTHFEKMVHAGDAKLDVNLSVSAWLAVKMTGELEPGLFVELDQLYLRIEAVISAKGVVLNPAYWSIESTARRDTTSVLFKFILAEAESLVPKIDETRAALLGRLAERHRRGMLWRR